MSFTPLQNLIPRAANHYGVARQMEAAKICHDFRQLLKELFQNPDAYACISPASYQKNTLTINVTSPAWAQEIIIRKPKIIDELNTRAGRDIIKNIKTQLSP